MSVYQVIAHNLRGFDLIIFITAVLNLICFVYTRRTADALYKLLHRLVFVPSHTHDPETLAEAIRSVDEEEALALRKRSESLYAVFVNVTAIFPLLGILGTVVSLLPMVADLSNMQMNFFSALTSTFWGLVFAIVFKLLDGIVLSAKVDDNEKSVALFLDRAPEQREEQEAAV